MPTKTVVKDKQFACDKCNRNVTFRYVENQYFADEFDEPIDKSVDRVLDYGQCQVAAEANIPKHPIYSEMQECPVYTSLS